ncbi:MAG: YihY/virulence factor BrkB family protein [Nitrospiraceae bacterium]|nr:YihY/virulence factor BrkB family protein [Nitrospiraceae bacterium]
MPIKKKEKIEKSGPGHLLNFPEFKRLFNFIIRVLAGFKRNQGLLLGGALAYYTLLSIVPMSILALIGLSHIVGEKQLFRTLAVYLDMLIPGYAATLTAEVRIFVRHGGAVSVIGLIIMLFFSSVAFTVLENAMSVIFFHRVRTKRRHFMVSAVIPYVYIIFLGIGILIVSFIAGALQALQTRHPVVMGWSLQLRGAYGTALYALGIIGEIFMLTSVYLVMPVGRMTLRHAVTGGITATILWEITRRVLVWYYSTLSMVNLIYGSFATSVVALIGIEAASLILLLGAQVIAELERKRHGAGAGKTSGFFET